MRLERLERDLTEEACFSVWVSPNGRDQLEAPMTWADYVASGREGGQPPIRPASIPQNYTLVYWYAAAKYTNGQHEGNLRPNQYGELSGWAEGSGPSLDQRRARGTIRVIAAKMESPTEEETKWDMRPGQYVITPRNELTVVGPVIIPDRARGKEFSYLLVDDELTKVSERGV